MAKSRRPYAGDLGAVRYLAEAGYLGNYQGDVQPTTRDEALGPDAMVLQGQIDPNTKLTSDWVELFCYLIERNGLKPWGRVGRKYLRDAMNKLAEYGCYDALHYCDGCREEVYVGCSENVAFKYDDAYIDDRLANYREILDRDKTDLDEPTKIGRLASYREELKKNQKRTVRQFEDAQIDELIRCWRTEEPVSCEACRRAQRLATE